MIPISYNVRSLAVRKTTTVMTALGIALVVFVLAASQMLANGVRKTLGKAGDPTRAFVLRKGADAELSSAVENPKIGWILGAPGVKRSATGKPLGVGEIVVMLGLSKVGEPSQVSNLQMRGIPDDGLAFRNDVRIIAGRRFEPGTDEVIVGKRIRGVFEGLELGQKLEIKKNRMAAVVGVFEAEGSAHESEILSDVELVRSSFGRQGRVSSVTVQLESADAFERFHRAVEGNRELGLNAMRETEYYEKQSEGTAALVSFLGEALVFFFSIAAIIGATITMYAAVSQRRKEVGTLRALGFSRFTILSSFLLESALLALIGGAIGATASLGMGFLHFSMMNMTSWSEITFSFDASPEIIVRCVVGGTLMGILGGLLPALQAARISPVEAMRD